MDKSYFWLAVSSFTDKGMVIKAVEENMPLVLNELHVLISTYAFIVNSTPNGILVGPIPVSNNPELRVFIYPFEVIDYGVKDLRIIKNGWIVRAYVLLFFSSSMENSFLTYKSAIAQQISKWCKKVNVISDIDHELLKKLGSVIERSLPDREKLFDLPQFGNAVERWLIFQQLYFLSKLVANEYDVLFIFNSKIHFSIFKEFFFVHSWNLIDKYQFDSDGSFHIRMGKVRIRVSLADKLVIPVKDKSVILFTRINGDENDQEAIDQIKYILSLLTEKDAFLLGIYTSSGVKPPKTTPLRELLSIAGKNTLVVELSQENPVGASSLIEFLQLVIENQQQQQDHARRYHGIMTESE